MHDRSGWRGGRTLAHEGKLYPSQLIAKIKSSRIADQQQETLTFALADKWLLFVLQKNLIKVA